MGIPISERHGVNPSVMLCFYCNKPYGVALLGRLPKDAEAPREGVFETAPCNECAAFMRQGVILISVSESKTTNVNNPWRSGGWCVVRDSAIERMFDEPMRGQVLKARVAFVEDEAWDKIGLPRGEEQAAGHADEG